MYFILEIGGIELFFYDISVNRHLKIKETPNHIYIAPHPLLSNYIAHYTISFPNTNEMKTCRDNISDITWKGNDDGTVSNKPSKDK